MQDTEQMLHDLANPGFRVELEFQLGEKERAKIAQFLEFYFRMTAHQLDYPNEWRGTTLEKFLDSNREKGREVLKEGFEGQFKDDFKATVTSMLSSGLLVVEYPGLPNRPPAFTFQFSFSSKTLAFYDNNLANLTMDRTPSANWISQHFANYFVDEIALGKAVKDVLSEQGVQHQPQGLKIPSAAEFLKWVMSRSGLNLSLDYNQISNYEDARLLKAISDMARESGAQFDGGYNLPLGVFLARIIARAFVFSEEFRTRVDESLDLTAVTTEDATTSSHLAQTLFTMMTSPDPRIRNRYQEIRALFKRIFNSEFEFDVSSRQLSESLSQSAGSLGTLQGEPRVTTRVGISITNTSSQKTIPIRFTGSGLTEVLYLLTLIAGLEEKVICLDEPASHVHPSTQRLVLDEISKLSGNDQIFMITHSPYLLSSRFLTESIRFYLTAGSTRWSRLPEELAGEIRAAKLVERSPSLLSTLFAQKAILFEGEYEQAALVTWFGREEVMSAIERADIGFIAVNGHSSFPAYAKFLSAWKLDCFAIGDRKASESMRDIPNHFALEEDDFSELLEKECKAEYSEALKLYPGRQGGKNPQIARYVAEKASPPREILKLAKKLTEFVK